MKEEKGHRKINTIKLNDRITLNMNMRDPTTFWW